MLKSFNGDKGPDTFSSAVNVAYCLTGAMYNHIRLAFEKNFGDLRINPVYNESIRKLKLPLPPLIDDLPMKALKSLFDGGMLIQEDDDENEEDTARRLLNSDTKLAELLLKEDRVTYNQGVVSVREFQHKVYVVSINKDKSNPEF